MLHKTKGIVLGFVKYRETSVVVRIYTEQFGLQGYIVNGVRSAKAKRNRIGLYQPLTLLDLVVYHRENQHLHRISEAQLFHPYHSLPFQPKKSGIVLFLAEVLNKVLKEEESYPELFGFLTDSLVALDQMPDRFENFHLQFLVQLAAWVGFAIPSYQSLLQQMDLQAPDADLPEAQWFDELLQSDYQTHVPANGQLRSSILQLLMRFFRYHFEHFGEVKSLPVLQEVFG